MPEIDIRPAVSSDLPALIQFVHGCESTHTLQMDSNIDLDQFEVRFRKIRLPRSIKLEYPRNPEFLTNTWKKRVLFLVARIDTQRCGYLTMDLIENRTGEVIDLVVDEPFRRQRVASTLLVAAQDWLRQNGKNQLRLELPIKNHAAIEMAEKLHFEFCGFMDRFFNNLEIAVFYSIKLR